MMYWVTYRKGSFWIKERFACGVRANARAIVLCASANGIEIVDGQDHEGLAGIAKALELPALGEPLQ